jgi:general stress protein 26
MSTLKETFWKRMGDVQAGLLAADGERPIPMSPQADPEEGAIWFITAAGSTADRASKSGGEASFHVADPKAGLYANVWGKVDEHTNEEKLDELWNAFAAAWFPKGRKDHAVRLVKFSPHDAEVWANDGSASFLYEVAKSNVSEHTPDAGEHGRVVF